VTEDVTYKGQKGKCNSKGNPKYCVINYSEKLEVPIVFCCPYMPQNFPVNNEIL
jgi:hypothetical protein